jgi:predicted LPLAT superfamily acyltransferase
MRLVFLGSAALSMDNLLKLTFGMRNKNFQVFNWQCWPTAELFMWGDALARRAEIQPYASRRLIQRLHRPSATKRPVSIELERFTTLLLDRIEALKTAISFEHNPPQPRWRAQSRLISIPSTYRLSPMLN